MSASTSRAQQLDQAIAAAMQQFNNADAEVRRAVDRRDDYAALRSQQSRDAWRRRLGDLEYARRCETSVDDMSGARRSGAIFSSEAG